jgi:hypothetical protein
MTVLKEYKGRIPSCGVFCGGCPMYIKKKNPCPGAEINYKRCEKCKTFHICCKDRDIIHCHECNDFPCKKFKDFSKRWLKYGQNFIDNQIFLRENRDKAFLDFYNSKVKKDA